MAATLALFDRNAPPRATPGAWAPFAWLTLQAAALWPHAQWVAGRMLDGSDDPLGLVALAVLGVWAARHGTRLRREPRSGWAMAGVSLTLAATAALFLLPPLAAAVCAALAMSATWCAFRPARVPVLPAVGLAVLALPVVASLQFYAGFPLRVVTAEASAWALRALGFVTERAGTTMQVDGQLVLVDAPCSGVQMVWMAYFCACCVAAFGGLRDRALLARLPGVGLLVLAGNVLRNTVLVALEARDVVVGEWLHQGIGLVVLVAVCAGVVALVGRRRPGDRDAA